MKEKWYYCDWFTNDTKINSILWPIVFTFIIIVSLIVGSIFYNKEKENYNEELNSYSENDYINLNNIANNTIEKDRINTVSIPDTVEYEIIKKDNQITYNLFLKNSKAKKWSDSTNIMVTLSKNYEILDKVPNYCSKENYVKTLKFNFYVIISLFSIMTSYIILLIIVLLLVIALPISMLHKKIDMIKNKPNN